MAKKLSDGFCRDFEMGSEQLGEILFVKGRPQRKLGIVKDDIRQLDDRLHDRLIPVFLAGFNHTIRETMQGNIENMTPTLKPGGQTAQSMVVLEKQDFMAAIGQTVGGGESAEAGTDDNDIVCIV